MTDELLIKYLAGDADPVEAQEVQEWMSMSVANERYFNQFTALWDGSYSLMAEKNINVDAAWSKFQQRLQPVVIKRHFHWMRVAAAIVILLTFAVGGYQWLRNDTVKDIALVTADEVKAETLPDGTVATLNKHSTIHYPDAFKGKNRKIKLEGEAFFSVTPDKAKPFIIDVNDVEITVVGTSFNVKNNSLGTEVIVETGIVKVMRNNRMVELRAGEQLFLPSNDSVINKETSTDQLYTYYRSKTFVCDNTPLWKLVEKLNEVYGVPIVIENNKLRSLPLNVTFDDESLDVILDVIRQTLLVKISRDDNSVRIY